MRIILNIVLASLLVLGCQRSSPTEPVTTALAKGVWSSDAARLEVKERSVYLRTRGCLTGEFQLPNPDSAGHFQVDGTYRAFSGGPGLDPVVAGQLVGNVADGRVLLVVKNGTEAVAGPFEVRFGETLPPPPPCPA